MLRIASKADSSTLRQAIRGQQQSELPGHSLLRACLLTGFLLSMRTTNWSQMPPDQGPMQAMGMIL